MEAAGLMLGLRKGAWTEEEDNLLRNCIEKYGEQKWHQVPLRAGLNRCRKSCRLRWLNYLKPNIKRGAFATDEIDLIIRLHKLLGNRWSLIAGRIPGRTANDVKNYWNTHLRKKLNNPCKKLDHHVKSSPKVEKIEKINVIRPRPRTFSRKYSSLPWTTTMNGSGATSIMNIESSAAHNLYKQPEAMESEIMWWERLLAENEHEQDGACWSDDADGNLWDLFD